MNLVFVGTEQDKPYLARLKPCIGVGNPCKVILQPTTTLTEIVVYCRKNNITGVITTQQALIQKLTGEDYGKKQPSLDDYAGSLFNSHGIEWLFIHPLEHFITVPFGKFLNSRYISKLTDADSWYTSTPFSWEIATEESIAGLYERFQDAILMAVDIETRKEPLSINCIGYCALFISPTGVLSSHSIVLPLTSEFWLAWIRKFNTLSVPKVLQNGKYDISYLMRYNAPLTDYYFDTANMHHCWYSELPKDLGRINAFYVRDARYWKHEADTAQNLEEYYLYNAKDTHATLNAAISWLLHAPAWAKNNYLMEFPTVYPCIVSELTGIKRDMAKQEQQLIKLNNRIAEKTAKLQKMVATPNFNSNSHVQVKQLLKAIGCADLATSSDEKNLQKAAFRHPLNAILMDAILDIRGDRKLVSTYFGKEFTGSNGIPRILYSLNPHGTDTGRLASTEHHFWCGLQLQNIPRGDEVKCTLVPDDDFLMGEADYEQAESRDTGYITGDTNLIAAVEGTRDFHSLNASAFFGVPYEEIYQDATPEYIDNDTGLVVAAKLAKVINKALRDLSKRTNHGANYKMGAAVMLDTMGLKKVYEAQKLLGLPKYWQPKQVTQHLLDVFAKTYPVVANDYPDWVIYQVLTSRMLVGATGWTRYCFKDPAKDKRALNSYVAHNPQSLNAMTLNKAFMKIFYEIWLPHHKNFKLYGQIHDSILFAYRKGHEYLADMVRECMTMSIPVTDIKGITRQLVVPVDVKIGLTRWSGE